MDCASYCPTGKLEKLLLATDMSEHSEGAVREAINFAKKCKSKLYAMTVVEMFTEMETLGKNIYQQEEIRVRKYLEDIKERAAAEGVDCEVIVHFSDEPHIPIVEEAELKKVDMIILGRRGTKGLAKLLLGQVAAKVIGYAPCDVMVVPKAARVEYKHILVATDGSAHAKAAVSKALDIAKRCGGSVIAVSAIRNDSELEEAKSYIGQAAEMAQKEGISIETMTPTGRSYDVIVETAGGRSVDLIVMGTYGKTGLQKILMGSSTERVIGLAGCGVLVVK